MDLYAEQIQIEEMARQTGINKFHERTQEKIEKGNEAGTYYGASLMRRAIAPVAEGIRDYIAARETTTTASRRNGSYHYLKLVEPEVAAYLAVKALINGLSKNTTTSSQAVNIGRFIEDEVRYKDFKEQAPGLFHQVMNQTRVQRDSHKRTVLMHTYQKHVAHWEGWTPSAKIHLGALLIDLVIEKTNFVYIDNVIINNKTSSVIRPTAAVLKWMEDTQENASTLHPLYLPMVVKPTPWTSPFAGAYLSPILRPVYFIKTSNRAYLEEVAQLPEQMQPVYEAVNAIQEVPWRINKSVLEVFEQFWEQGVSSAGLPERANYPIPAYPFPDTPKEDLTEDQLATVKAWKLKAATLHRANKTSEGKRVSVAQTLTVATRFSKYEEIFFPHNLDFRGRVYSVPSGLSPQGADHSKGLLQFAEGKPIGDGTGPGWLAIHGANVRGYDKASMEGRIEWVEENQDKILACAADPYANLWWADCKKPWGFLAFCFEWAGYIKDGADHLTHMPIALDGSCSGLQHFSAALRDPVGGAAVNLVGKDVPSDVYQEVADLVIGKLRAIARSDKADAGLASRILEMGIDRDTTKRATMTLPYGSTRHSCRSFIMEWLTGLIKTNNKVGRQNVLEGIEAEAVTLITGFVWESIGEVVIAARSAMDWLRLTAQVLCKEKLPINWTTPDGLPIMQEYRDMKARRVKTRFGDRFVYMTLTEHQDNLDARRQSNGLPPNWVHSMDGTHLRMAINYAKDNGLTSFAVIHDSFGTHACDTDMLAACLRHSMVDLYATPVLEEFRAEVCAPLGNLSDAPPVPEMGDLDLNLILESEYVFA